MKKRLTEQRTWTLLGMIVGLIVIIIGLVFMATPADSYETHSADYASFGADYYTYEYEATRAAASNAAITANNLRELSGKVALYSGTFFVVLGVLIVLANGKTYFCCLPSQAAEVPAKAQPEVAGGAPEEPSQPETAGAALEEPGQAEAERASEPSTEP